jgi:hypothetical protein
VGIDPGRRFAAASAMRLAAPSPQAAKGLTLGGASIDAFGRWAPAAPEMLQLQNGHVLVEVPGASAALVRLRH